MDAGEISSSPLTPHNLWQVEDLALWSREQENLLCLSSAVVLERVDPAPHLSSKIELTKLAGSWASWLEDMSVG